MLKFRTTLAQLARNRGQWAKRVASHTPLPEAGSISTRLEEGYGFGSNPGNLRMFSHLPPSLAANRALVVVLHGCTQTAAGYDHGSGWSTIADRYGFALLLPEQQRSNNHNGCFNWFQSGDIQRGRGEALSIRQMIEKFVIDNRIDRRRIFITGLSAGGAMTSVMLACYPDVFAGGAIIAGLPFGAAANIQQAFESMFQSPGRSAQEWGDLVRGAVPHHHGPWPRISVWHGEADKTVIPSNAREILKQWTEVHGLPMKPSDRAKVDGYPREVWVNEAGEELIESYTITHMAHGTPLATGKADDECGTAGPFLLEVGISSSYHIAKFFGLTTTEDRHFVSAKSETVKIAPGEPPDRHPAAALTSAHVLEGEVLDKDFDVKPQQRNIPPSSPIDIGAVITKALKAAGIIKSS